MYLPYSVYPLICWWTFGLCPLLAPAKSAAMNIGVQISESLLSVILGTYLEVVPSIFCLMLIAIHRWILFRRGLASFLLPLMGICILPASKPIPKLDIVHCSCSQPGSASRWASSPQPLAIQSCFWRMESIHRLRWTGEKMGGRPFLFLSPWPRDSEALTGGPGVVGRKRITHLLVGELYPFLWIFWSWNRAFSPKVCCFWKELKPEFSRPNKSSDSKWQYHGNGYFGCAKT